METIQEGLFVQMALTQWKNTYERVEKIIGSISEEKYSLTPSHGGNSTNWIICHLIHANENTSLLLGIGSPLFPQVSDYLQSKSNRNNTFSKSEIQQMWSSTITRLVTAIVKFEIEDWFSPHTAVSEEDFKKEPHRNKLNVLLSRTNHMAHHAGQLALIK